MTIIQIQSRLKTLGKKITKAGLYKHIRALNLKPLGIGRPANYRFDTLDQIAARLGVDLPREIAAHDDGKNGRAKGLKKSRGGK